MSKYRTLSPNNPYYMEREDYIDTIRWCLRYPKWKAELSLDPDSSKALTYDQDRVQTSGDFDPVEALGMRRVTLAENCRIIEDAINKVDPEIFEYLLRGVAYGFTETQLINLKMPCNGKKYRREKQHVLFLISQKIL